MDDTLFDKTLENLIKSKSVNLDLSLGNLKKASWNSKEVMAVAWDSFVLVTGRTKPRGTGKHPNDLLNPGTELTDDSSLRELLEAIKEAGFFRKEDEKGFIYLDHNKMEGIKERKHKSFLGDE